MNSTREDRPFISGVRSKDFAISFENQLWCLGQDIRHTKGNLLVRYGFTRCRVPEGIAGCSRYHIPLPCEATLTLWGFAALIQYRTHTLIVKRFEHSPWIYQGNISVAEMWSANHLPEPKPPRTEEEKDYALALLTLLAEAFAGYEQFVHSTVGPLYRRKLLAGRALSGTHRHKRHLLLSETWSSISPEKQPLVYGS